MSERGTRRSCRVFDGILESGGRPYTRETTHLLPHALIAELKETAVGLMPCLPIFPIRATARSQSPALPLALMAALYEYAFGFTSKRSWALRRTRVDGVGWGGLDWGAVGWDGMADKTECEDWQRVECSRTTVKNAERVGGLAPSRHIRDRGR